jgi:hypothetical protein
LEPRVRERAQQGQGWGPGEQALLLNPLTQLLCWLLGRPWPSDAVSCIATQGVTRGSISVRQDMS